jgi:GntR family transcriptional repressor for pyruvate dehydrogenase complex
MLATHRKKLTEEISDLLLERIKNGTYKIGDKLPPELTLASELGVSRGTLREAIKKLSLMGILDVRQGEGTFVRETSIASIIDTLKLFLDVDYNTIIDLLVARLFIEKGIVSIVAETIKPSDIVRLNKMLMLMNEAIQKKDSFYFSRLDEKFHFELAHIAGNKILQKMMETIRYFIATQQQYMNIVAGIVEKSNEDHKQIVEAVAHHDVAQAETLVAEHIKFVIKAIEKEKQVEEFEQRLLNEVVND